MFDLQKIFSYLHFLDEFRRIKRAYNATGEDRKENDMEHSYQLAMLAWYIIDTQGLSLEKDLVLKYCMVHDLVEVYAWDTYIYGHIDHLNSKSQREQEALATIKTQFSEFPDMIGHMEQYEKRKDKESIFVYALDKIIPVISIYMDNGRSWKELEIAKVVITIEKLRAIKDPKIEKSPELYGFWLQFIEVLEANRKDLFLE